MYALHARHVLAVVWLVVYFLFQFSFYVLVPVMLRASDATIFNLGLLTSDVYTLLIGLFLFHFTVRACLRLQSIRIAVISRQMTLNRLN